MLRFWKLIRIPDLHGWRKIVQKWLNHVVWSIAKSLRFWFIFRIAVAYVRTIGINCKLWQMELIFCATIIGGWVFQNIASIFANKHRRRYISGGFDTPALVFGFEQLELMLKTVLNNTIYAFISTAFARAATFNNARMDNFRVSHVLVSNFDVSF